MEKQLSKDQAIALFKSEIWKDWSPEERGKFQLFQDLLCIPFDVFHEGIEKLLGRPVWTYEFANKDALIKEYLGEKEAPTMQDIIEMIPAEKRIVIGI